MLPKLSSLNVSYNLGSRLRLPKFLLIFADFILTLEILLPFIKLKWNSIEIFFSWAKKFRLQLIKLPTDPLRLITKNNTRPSCITAAAGTELAGASSLSNVIILLNERDLQQKVHSSLTQHCWVRLSPIAQYSSLQPLNWVWAVSQSQCGCTPVKAN